MRKRSADDPDAVPRPRGENVLNPLVALLAHHDDAAAADFREVFDDVAVDWRLVRVAEGAAAARHIMNKGLPELLVISADLPEMSGPDFVDWVRSFRSGYPIPVLIYGEPKDAGTRACLARDKATSIIAAPCPRAALAGPLADLVAQVEMRRFPSMA